MKRFFLVSAATLGLVAASCGSNAGKRAEADSIARADSIREADSIRVADSIVKVVADSIARIDSIAKAEKAKAETSRDKSIDKDLKDLKEMGDEMDDIYDMGGHPTPELRENLDETRKRLEAKKSKMTPDQRARYKKLTK